MENHQEEDYGYGAVDEVGKEMGSGIFLSLKNKGDKVTIRIVSKPKYLMQYWVEGENGKQKAVPATSIPNEEAKKRGLQKDSKWAWIVIDRADGEIKAFTGKFSVAKKIEKLTKLIGTSGKPMWGDPRTFDIVVTRTEEKGPNYYTVDPSPENKGPITAEEQKKVDEASTKIDLDKVLNGKGKDSENVGNYDNADVAMETVPEGAEEGAKAESEEASEDDIPF